MSFRQTIHGLKSSDRGFIIKIDRADLKVLVSFDYLNVSEKHSSWLSKISKNVGISELNPQPYWGFDDLSNKAGTKLINCFLYKRITKLRKG